GNQSITWNKIPNVIFRNNFGPDFSPIPPENNQVYIHQQPWEWTAIPQLWIDSIRNNVDELWMPSYYNKEIYIKNRIQEEKLFVVPHGVHTLKWEKIFAKKNKIRQSEFSKKKKRGKGSKSKDQKNSTQQRAVKYLAIGGAVSRKGWDILTRAYLQAFQVGDKVSFITHSNADRYWVRQLVRLSKRNDIPNIRYVSRDLTKINFYKLWLEADVYVSAYRSEGFGLT